jgi:hypothetical protein
MTTTEQKIRSLQADLIGLAGYGHGQAYLADLKIMGQKMVDLKADIVPIMEQLDGIENPVEFLKLAKKIIKIVKNG